MFQNKGIKQHKILHRKNYFKRKIHWYWLHTFIFVLNLSEKDK